MRPAGEILVLAILGSLPLAAAESTQHFRFWKPLASQPTGQEEICAFALDSDIYAATRDRCADLRVFDATGAEAPYQLERHTGKKTERVRRDVPTDVLSLKEEGSAIEVQIALRKESPPAAGMTFAIPLTNYERKVRVFGSADGQQWTEAVSDGLIFDYSRYMDVHNTDIRLPANTYRRFRLLIEDVVEERESPFLELTKTAQQGQETQRVERVTIERRPLRVDHIAFWREVAEERLRIDKTTDYPIERFAQSEDAELKQTILRVHCRRQPLTSFTLRTASRNFARAVTVEVPVADGPRTRWDTVGRQTVRKFSFRSFRREDLTVEFPEQRQSEYRIVIANEDNPPLAISGVQATGNVYRAVFLAQPSTTYRVFYGAENATRPNYEASTVLGALRDNYQTLSVELGPQAVNPQYVAARDDSWLQLLNRPWFLVFALCVVVMVLGWGLFQATRHLRNDSDCDADSHESCPR